MTSSNPVPESLRLADSHAHLADPAFDVDRAAVLARATEAGVDTFVLVGIDATSSVRSRALARSVPGAVATVGIHPHEIEGRGPDALAEIGNLAREGGFAGVGETGLDWVRSKTAPERQREALAAHVQWARALGLPLVLHCREAFRELFEILREHGGGTVSGVLHCFTGGPDEAKEAVALGLYVSFSGILTFPRAEAIQAAAAWVPRERLLVETDCPYLAPVPHRAVKRNEPAFVVATAALLSRLRGESKEDVFTAVRANARRLFRIL